MNSWGDAGLSLQAVITWFACGTWAQVSWCTSWVRHTQTWSTVSAGTKMAVPYVLSAKTRRCVSSTHGGAQCSRLFYNDITCACAVVVPPTHQCGKCESYYAFTCKHWSCHNHIMVCWRFWCNCSALRWKRRFMREPGQWELCSSQMGRSWPRASAAWVRGSWRCGIRYVLSHQTQRPDACNATPQGPVLRYSKSCSDNSIHLHYETIILRIRWSLHPVTD